MKTYVFCLIVIFCFLLPLMSGCKVNVKELDRFLNSSLPYITTTVRLYTDNDSGDESWRDNNDEHFDWLWWPFN